MESIKLLSSNRFKALLYLALFFNLLAFTVLAELSQKEKDENLKEGMVMLESKAAEGNQLAQFHLGNIYLYGMSGIEKDAIKGFNYLKESANGGYDKAQYNLAAAYLKGDGVTQNDEKALKWYLNSAEKGYAPAQLQTYRLLRENGEIQEAITWLEKAANSGEYDAIFLLGGEYLTGVSGVLQNYKKAYIWLSIAAALGDEEGMKLRDAASKKLNEDSLTLAQSEAEKLFEKIKEIKNTPRWDE